MNDYQIQNAPGLDVEAAQADPKAFLDNILSTANTQQQRAKTFMEIQVRFGEIVSKLWR